MLEEEQDSKMRTKHTLGAIGRTALVALTLSVGAIGCRTSYQEDSSYRIIQHAGYNLVEMLPAKDRRAIDELEANFLDLYSTEGSYLDEDGKRQERFREIAEQRDKILAKHDIKARYLMHAGNLSTPDFSISYWEVN